MVAGGIRRFSKSVCVALGGQRAQGALQVRGKVAPFAAAFEGSGGLAKPMCTARGVGLVCRGAPKALMLP